MQVASKTASKPKGDVDGFLAGTGGVSVFIFEGLAATGSRANAGKCIYIHGTFASGVSFNCGRLTGLGTIRLKGVQWRRRNVKRGAVYKRPLEHSLQRGPAMLLQNLLHNVAGDATNACYHHKLRRVTERCHEHPAPVEPSRRFASTFHTACNHPKRKGQESHDLRHGPFPPPQERAL
jgi:hypothetical protein